MSFLQEVLGPPLDPLLVTGTQKTSGEGTQVAKSELDHPEPDEVNRITSSAKKQRHNSEVPRLEDLITPAESLSEDFPNRNGEKGF